MWQMMWLKRNCIHRQYCKYPERDYKKAYLAWNRCHNCLKHLRFQYIVQYCQTHQLRRLESLISRKDLKRAWADVHINCGEIMRIISSLHFLKEKIRSEVFTPQIWHRMNEIKDKILLCRDHAVEDPFQNLKWRLEVKVKWKNSASTALYGISSTVHSKTKLEVSFLQHPFYDV